MEIVTTPILRFAGEHDYLSNMYLSQVYYNGFNWPSSENAYQAMKSTTPAIQHRFTALTPRESKRLGKALEVREDWEDVKIGIMHEIVLAKFLQNRHLAEKLIDTYGQQLIEGNQWKDTFWGVCPPGSKNGQNHLGRILMDVRLRLIHLHRSYEVM